MREQRAGECGPRDTALAQVRIHQVVAAVEHAPLGEIAGELLRGNQSGMAMIRIMAVTRAEIASVEKLIRPHVRRTPVIDPDGDGRRVFKLELLQHSGSFKARGAFANLLTRKSPLPAWLRPRAATTALRGLRGTAARQARAHLRPDRVVAGEDRAHPLVWRDLVVTGDRYADALAESEKWAAESGAMQIHAYDQEGALLGQGTVGMEFEEQAKLDTLLVAVGGGGLIGGIAAWFAGKVRIIGVEPVLAPTLTRRLEAGKPVDSPAGGIAADSRAPDRRRAADVPAVAQKIRLIALNHSHSAMTPTSPRQAWCQGSVVFRLPP